MSTLAKSGALYELHRKRGSLRIAVDFYESRGRQLRRSIRRQKLALFLLSCRVFFQPGRAIETPLPPAAIHRVTADGTVETFSALPVPAATTIRVRKPKLFSILTVRGVQWIVVGSDGFLFCHIVHLKKKLS